MTAIATNIDRRRNLEMLREELRVYERAEQALRRMLRSVFPVAQKGYAPDGSVILYHGAHLEHTILPTVRVAAFDSDGTVLPDTVLHKCAVKPGTTCSHGYTA